VACGKTLEKKEPIGYDQGIVFSNPSHLYRPVDPWADTDARIRLETNMRQAPQIPDPASVPVPFAGGELSDSGTIIHNNGTKERKT
jgi:hypothetical protein